MKKGFYLSDHWYKGACVLCVLESIRFTKKSVFKRGCARCSIPSVKAIFIFRSGFWLIKSDGSLNATRRSLCHAKKLDLFQGYPPLMGPRH